MFFVVVVSYKAVLVLKTDNLVITGTWFFAIIYIHIYVYTHTHIYIYSLLNKKRLLAT